MRTLNEVLEMLEGNIDRITLEEYISREWLRPVFVHDNDWHFEEIDIARLQLVRHLVHDIKINEEGMDVVLSLLDQLYGLRTHMQKLNYAIAQQPPKTQDEITVVIKNLSETGSS